MLGEGLIDGDSEPLGLILPLGEIDADGDPALGELLALADGEREGDGEIDALGLLDGD